MFKQLSRKEAQRQGLKRYYTGKPCVQGHDAERHVAQKRCTVCHREDKNIWRNRSRKRVKTATPDCLSPAQKREILEIYKSCLKMSYGDETFHVDHIWPLRNDKLCGLHVPWNLQILTAEDNMKKSNNLPTVI